MGHAEEDKQHRSEPPPIDIKHDDPVRDPAASTTEEDISRAEGEGMSPSTTPREPLPTLPEFPEVAVTPRRMVRR